ncbi:uncharacterized protein LOC108258663 [Ictalurus punctatus]|uniref:Uncharacterized protein LOC108258663 n=1 Tax=Ictalurus punctatus TaxID=7998 RepID=A0A2D0Q5H5_ICTPU|nr:uncharacterized protein LOC108258663 [Ictalurus punctatus]
MKPVSVCSSMKLLLAALCVAVTIHISASQNINSTTSTTGLTLFTSASSSSSSVTTLSTGSTQKSTVAASSSKPLSTIPTGGGVRIGALTDVLFMSLFVTLTVVMSAS